MNLYFVSVGNGENNSKKRGNFSLSGKKMQSINFKKDFQPKGGGKLTLGKLSTGFWSLFGGFLQKFSLYYIRNKWILSIEIIHLMSKLN